MTPKPGAAPPKSDYSAYTGFEAIGIRTAIMTCLRCGVAVLLDDDRAHDIHDRWHRENKKR